jgi:hypothetical protein
MNLYLGSEAEALISSLIKNSDKASLDGYAYEALRVLLLPSSRLEFLL